MITRNANNELCIDGVPTTVVVATGIRRGWLKPAKRGQVLGSAHVHKEQPKEKPHEP